ncbi:MAG: hypothetical protein II973_12610 [Spirochaetaceae bacterium]|nr:hypothetical protein [Spirochaetaceae bacterium]
MVDSELKTKILFEISEIDELLEKASILSQKCKIKEPDFIELSAVGSTIHSFYNGLENIFLLIQKHIDKEISSSERWHSELLVSMFKENENRKAVLDKSLQLPLTDYMGFRHFFRHSYGYHLRWDLAQPLFENMPDIWNSVKGCILSFIG